MNHFRANTQVISCPEVVESFIYLTINVMYVCEHKEFSPLLVSTVTTTHKNPQKSAFICVTNESRFTHDGIHAHAYLCFIRMCVGVEPCEAMCVCVEPCEAMCVCVEPCEAHAYLSLSASSHSQRSAFIFV